jgi:hypothetical protein
MEAVIGVDPHKHVLSTVALDGRGGQLGQWHGSATRKDIRELHTWAARLAPGARWAIEGSNFLGRSLALVLVEAGADVRDVCPTRTAHRRRLRPGRGKSDTVDAEAIAREFLAHPHLPCAFKAAAPVRPDPAREALAVLVRARHPPSPPAQRNRSLAQRTAGPARRALARRLQDRTPTRRRGAPAGDGRSADGPTAPPPA